MKFKKEYALLGIVVLALGLYLFLNKQDRVNYTLPETPRLDAAEINKIEITKAGKTITLTRQGDQWRLTPGNYPADTAQVKDMLKSIAELTITALVSETQSYARYDLDADRKIEVRAYKDQKVVRQFTVGKAASTFRHTHVLVDDDPKVYHAAGSFRWEFDKPVDDLRDKTVLAFDRDAVTTIKLVADGNQVVIRKQEPAPEDKNEGQKPEDAPPAGDQPPPAPEDRWVTAAGEAVDAAAVDQLLAGLAPLKCNAFLEDDAKTALTDPQYRLEIEGPTTKTLEIYPSASGTATEFAGISSDSPYPFTLTEFEVAKIKDFYSAVTGTGTDEAEAPSVQ